MSKEISCVVTHRFTDVMVSEDEYVRLFKTVTWQEQPWFPMPGRTAWYIFENQPLLVSSSELKLKGGRVISAFRWVGQSPLLRRTEKSLLNRSRFEQRYK